MPRRGGTMGFQNFPVSFDASRQILSNRSGENIGAGIQGAAMAMFARAQDRAQKREEKEREKAQREFLGPLIEQMSGGKLQAGDLASEDLPMAVNLAQAMQQEQQEAPLRQLQMENEQLRQQMLQAQMEAARRPSRVGEVIEPVPGQQYVFQNEGQIVPLATGKGAAGPMSQVGKILADLGAVAEVTPEEQAKVLRDAAARATEPRAGTGNPFEEGERIQIQAQIAQIENEILTAQRESARGNVRKGWDRVPIGAKFQDIIRQKTQELALLRQRLARIGGSGNAVVDAGAESAGNSGIIDPTEAGMDVDGFYRALEQRLR